MTSFEDRLAERNKQLKSAKTKVSIFRRGNRLWLRASLPPRKGSGRWKPQAVAANATATTIGLNAATEKARLLSLQIQTDKFNWGDWVKTSRTEKKSIGDWLVAFERDYFKQRGRTDKTETTWRKDYRAAFNKLSRDELLSVDYLLEVAEASKPNTKTRKRLCRAFRILIEFAGMEGSDRLRSIAGNYSSARTKEITIPTDERIQECWDLMPSPEWKVVYGLLACYGLRPSEVFFTDMGYRQELDEIVVDSSKVKGELPVNRKVWPICPNAWLEKLRSLPGKLPPIKLNRSRDKIGRAVTERFGYSPFDFTPYALRHAYAVRGILYHLQDSVCAKWMGHSLQIHCQTYQKWMDDRHSLEAYRKMRGL